MAKPSVAPRRASARHDLHHRHPVEPIEKVDEVHEPDRAEREQRPLHDLRHQAGEELEVLRQAKDQDEPREGLADQAP